MQDWVSIGMETEQGGVTVSRCLNMEGRQPKPASGVVRFGVSTWVYSSEIIAPEQDHASGKKRSYFQKEHTRFSQTMDDNRRFLHTMEGIAI